MRRKRQSSLIAEQERSKPVNGAVAPENALHHVNSTNFNNHTVAPVEPAVTITGLPDAMTGDF